MIVCDDKYYLIVKIVLCEEALEIVFNAGIDAFDRSDNRSERSRGAGRLSQRTPDVAFELHSTQ